MHAISALVKSATPIACGVVQCSGDVDAPSRERASSRLAALLTEITNTPWFQELTDRLRAEYPGFIERGDNGSAALSTLGKALIAAASERAGRTSGVRQRSASLINATMSDLRAGVAAMDHLPSALPLDRSDLALTAARILACRATGAQWDTSTAAIDFLSALGRVSMRAGHPHPERWR